jgi:hypothetical protein
VTLAEIGEQFGTSCRPLRSRCVQRSAKSAVQLFGRLGAAVVDLARNDEPLRHDDPRITR